MLWRRCGTSKLIALRDQLESARSGIAEGLRADRALLEAGLDAVGDWPIAPALCCSLRAILGGGLACAGELARVQHLARLELAAALTRAQPLESLVGALTERYASLVARHELMLAAERALSVVGPRFGANYSRQVVEVCDRLGAARVRLQDGLFQEVLDRRGASARPTSSQLWHELDDALASPRISTGMRAAMVARALDAKEEALSRWCARPAVPPALLAAYAFALGRDAALTEWQDLVHAA